jgi:superkiller protein 3
MSRLADIFVQARQYQQGGGSAQAEQLYRQILQTDPSHTDAWCGLGEICEAQGRFAEAEVSYQRAIQLSPGLGKAHNGLGIVLAQIGRLAQAVDSFQLAVAYEPHNAEFHHNLAVALDRQRQTAAAIASYWQALRLRPGFGQAHYNLGLALYRQGQHEEAIEQYRQALQIQPRYPDALNAIGSALAALGKLDEAVASFQQALQLRPGFADAHYNLGTAFGKQQQYQEAIDQFRQALHFKPDYAEAHCCLGTLLRRLGKLNEALGHSQKALTLKPHLAAAHNDMGLALAASGKPEDAKEHFRLALELDPPYARLWGLSSQDLSELGKYDAMRCAEASEVSTTSYTEIGGYFEFAPVYDLALKVCPQGIFVEVGAFMGRSTAYLACKIRDLPVELYVVDTWRGSGGADIRGDDQYTPMLVMNNGDLFDAFLDNMERCGVVQSLIPLRMRSLQAAKLFCDGSVEFCYLDAAHDYDSVKADLSAWFPKVKSGGIIAGDDYCQDWPGVVRAVNEFFADSGEITTIANSWVFRKP